MKSAEELHEVAPGLVIWQAWSPVAKVDLSATALRLERGWVFIDPIPLIEPLLQALVEQAPPLAIVLTNANHERASAALHRRFGVPRYAHSAAAHEVAVDHAFEDGALLFGELQAIRLQGGAPGEVALYAAARECLLVGDALINLDSTGLITLPGKYCEDAAELLRGLKKLLAFSFGTITFAHGLPIVHQASQRVAALFAPPQPS